MAKRFVKDDGVGKTLIKWWEELDEHRADRASLRRASTLTDVTLTPAYQRAFARLGPQTWKQHERDRIAAIVGLAAHVKTNGVSSLPVAMSERDKGSDRNPVSELRFRRLLESQDIDALFVGVRRVLPLIQHGTNLISLANDVLYWGDGVRKQWAYDYRWPADSN